MKISWSELAKARMKALGMSQEALSEILGVTQGAIGHWLNNRRKAKLDEIFSIMKALDVTNFSIVDENGTLEVDPKQLAPREGSEVSERLLFVLSQMGWSQSDFAKHFRVSPQTINNWIKRNSLSSSSAQTIAKETGFSCDWLMSGQGSPIPETESCHSSDEHTYAVIFPDKYYSAPLKGHIENIVNLLKALKINQDEISRFANKAKDSKSMIVTGDSMNPVMSDGDLVMFNTQDTQIRDGKYYVIRMGEVERVKMLIAKADGSLVIRSVNPDYEDEIISGNDIKNNKISILGRVWWSSGYM